MKRLILIATSLLTALSYTKRRVKKRDEFIKEMNDKMYNSGFQTDEYSSYIFYADDMLTLVQNLNLMSSTYKISKEKLTLLLANKKHINTIGLSLMREVFSGDTYNKVYKKLGFTHFRYQVMDDKKEKVYSSYMIRIKRGANSYL